MKPQDMLEELRQFDTPSITNVVATYPESKLCLGLYNPWTENWYTDQTIRPMYPELGPLVGYAVTCVYSLPDPNFKRLTFMDVLDALDDRYDAAVIDPPSDGLSGDALDALVDLDVPRLVYVSSDPATLARDGKRLAAKGYRLNYAQPIDLAPQTYFIDTIGVFER